MRKLSILLIAIVVLSTDLTSFAGSTSRSDYLQPTIQIGRGDIRDIDWHPSGDILTVDTNIGAWIYTDTLADITHLDIRRARFSPDGQWIAGANDDHQIILYDVETFTPQITLTQHWDEVFQLAWHPTDPNRLTSIQDNGALIEWDIAAQEPIFYDLELDHIQKLLWNPTGEYIAAQDFYGQITVWNGTTHAIAFTLGKTEYSGNFVTDFFWQDDYRIARSWHGDGGTREAWDILTGRQLLAPTSNAGFKTSTDEYIISPDGRFRAESHGRFTDSQIVDQATGEVLQTIPPNLGFWGRAVWSPDSQKVALFGSNHNITTWDVANNRLIGQSDIHAQIGSTVKWSDDGQIIATAGYSPDAHLWDVNTGEHLAALSGRSQPAPNIDWQPDGPLLATSGFFPMLADSAESIVQIWDTSNITDPYEPFAIIPFDHVILDTAWHPDGQSLAIFGSQVISIWSLEQQALIFEFDFSQPTNGHVCQSIYTGHWSTFGDVLRVYTLTPCGGLFTIDTPLGDLTMVVGNIVISDHPWSPQNEYMWTGVGQTGPNEDRFELQIGRGFVQPYDDITLPEHNVEILQTIPIGLAEYSSTYVALDYSGTYVGMVYDDRLAIWEIATGEPVFVRSIEMSSFLWSPDSNHLALVNGQGGVSILNWQTGQMQATASLNDYWFRVDKLIYWSPDGQRIATLDQGVLSIFDLPAEE